MFANTYKQIFRYTVYCIAVQLTLLRQFIDLMSCATATVLCLIIYHYMVMALLFGIRPNRSLRDYRRPNTPCIPPHVQRGNFPHGVRYPSNPQTWS